MAIIGGIGMIRTFYATGYAPAYNELANKLLKAFDLGVEGAFRPFADRLTVTVIDDATQDQLDRQPDGIRNAYIDAGCIDVTVTLQD